MAVDLSNPNINIRTLNRSYEELLDTHDELLKRKNVRSKQRLLQIIKLDLDKLTHGLLEAKCRRAWPVLNNFFAGHAAVLPQITGRLEQNVIDHLGFEIHEPLDLVLYGLQHWITKTRRAFRCDLRIQDFLRFPASDEFQRRVGSYTEIMRLWIRVNEQTLMLELFDIHRPVDGFFADEPRPLTHRNFDCLVTHTDTLDEDAQQVENMFQGDDIWHYAFQVGSFDDVEQLHEGLRELAARDPAYLLPYDAPVRNLGDGSLHTKIVNQVTALEVEFLAFWAHEPRLSERDVGKSSAVRC